MLIISRRSSLALGAGAAAAVALPSIGKSAVPIADVKQPNWPIEKGATLRLLRPTKFVDADETIFRENVAKFQEQYKVPTRVDFLGWEDLRPQVGVAAMTGAGPDLVIGWPDDPHLYSDKIIELSDIAEYLGKKYGGWYFLAEKYGKKWGTNNWIGLPFGGSGGPLVYRKSWVKEAGFDKIPTDHEGFLKLCQNLKKNGHPAGFALGNAVGDGNAWCHWALWSFNGYEIDPDGKVAINQKATRDALAYHKELYQSFIPGTLAWNDVSNNKAYQAGELSLTQNGVSLYVSVKNDPVIGPDTDHAPMPLGLAASRPETALILNGYVFKHTKYPNACKQFLSFMMEQPQYEKWLTGTAGYWAQSLKAYAKADVWNSDPKIKVYQDTCDDQFWNGYKGPISHASAQITTDYVNIQMFASVAGGQASIEDAIREAERRAKRIYRS